MTDQTNLEYKIREILDGEGSAEDKIQAIYDDLLPPAPLPDPLFGARAAHPEYGEGIVTSHFLDSNGDVRFMFRHDDNNDGTRALWLPPSRLTFHTPNVSKNGSEIVTMPDSMFLAEATHPDHGEGIVVSHFPYDDGDVRFMFPNGAFGDGTDCRWLNPSTLTFHTPGDHPEFLESEEDYRSAPEGTIVARNEMWPYVLTMSRWEYPHQNFADHEDMAGFRRRVLRWGGKHD